MYARHTHTVLSEWIPVVSALSKLGGQCDHHDSQGEEGYTSRIVVNDPAQGLVFVRRSEIAVKGLLAHYLLYIDEVGFVGRGGAQDSEPAVRRQTDQVLLSISAQHDSVKTNVGGPVQFHTLPRHHSSRGFGGPPFRDSFGSFGIMPTSVKLLTTCHTEDETAFLTHTRASASAYSQGMRNCILWWCMTAQRSNEADSIRLLTSLRAGKATLKTQ